MRLAEEAAKLGDVLLIQLHTHPREAFHSRADDADAITKHTGTPIARTEATRATEPNSRLSITEPAQRRLVCFCMGDSLAYWAAPDDC